MTRRTQSTSAHSPTSTNVSNATHAFYSYGNLMSTTTLKFPDSPNETTTPLQSDNEHAPPHDSEHTDASSVSAMPIANPEDMP